MPDHTWCTCDRSVSKLRAVRELGTEKTQEVGDATESVSKARPSSGSRARSRPEPNRWILSGQVLDPATFLIGPFFVVSKVDTVAPLCESAQQRLEDPEIPPNALHEKQNPQPDFLRAGCEP
jgi:hypothetical protein